MARTLAQTLTRVLNATGEALRFHDSKSRILPENPAQDCWLQDAHLDESGCAVINYSQVGKRGVFSEKAASLRLDDLAGIINGAALLVL